MLSLLCWHTCSKLEKFHVKNFVHKQSKMCNHPTHPPLSAKQGKNFNGSSVHFMKFLATLVQMAENWNYTLSHRPNRGKFFLPEDAKEKQ